MATYKVPQDVEADDKLIGPFSFRQFIYLIIVALAGIAAWGLSQLFIGLVIIPLPIIVFFGALALPLRKDQPMEIYMAAMVSFYLKPRQRLWDPEGIESLIEISAPRQVEESRTKDLSQAEAAQRLSYLADIVDSGGWAIRGVSGASGTAMNNDVYLEAQSATDILDTNTSVAQGFDQMMMQRTEQMHEEARERMMQASIPTPNPSQTNDPLLAQLSQQMGAGQGQATPNTPLHMNPYPTFHQSIIQPLNDTAHQATSDISTPVAQPAPVAAPIPAQPQPQAAAPAPAPVPTYAPAPAVPVTPVTAPKTEEKKPTTSDTALSAGIMNLANNPDLSIETIAHEASRLHKKAEQDSEEVVISLR